MGWSTKVAIGGDIHGSQVNRHPPHHPPSSYSLVGARLKHFTLIVRLYGFEGEAGQEGEGQTRIRESSGRRIAHRRSYNYKARNNFELFHDWIVINLSEGG